MNKLTIVVGLLIATAMNDPVGATESKIVPDGYGTIEIQPYRDSSPEADLIYHILLGEIAGTRKQLEVALEYYRKAVQASENPRIAERAVGIALFANDNTALLEIARRWHTLDADNPKVHQALAIALLNNKQAEAAAVHLDKLRATADKDNQDGFTAVDALLNQVQDKALALRAMASLRDLHANSRYAQYYYALAALEADAHEQALEGITAALKLDPQWENAYLLQARVRMNKKDTDGALAGLKEAVTNLPENRQLRLGYARLLVNAERLDEATAEFEVLAARDPKDAEVIYSLGLLSGEKERYDEAVTYFTRLLELGTRNTDAFFELGRVEELRSNYDKAKDWYAQVEGDERYLTAQVRMGVMLAKSGDLPAMNEHFVKVRQDNPQSWVPLYISQAEVLRELKHHESAFDLLTEALERESANQDLLYSRALTAGNLKRFDVLEKDLRTVIDADPEHGHALNALGYTLADQTDRYQEALGYVERAIALLPNDAAVIDSMGWVQYRLGNYEQSLEYLRRAYELNQDPEIAAHLTEVLWVLGQREEARDVFQESMKDNPDSEFLLDVKERFGL
ncbi:MAG: tetratricopeptide repeat protein [Candidatus Competibacteraceae bacterium]|jgi:tetratricopeptide (TPR) repeat protein|nr:tetratricopeptide repeat protein [Candidatus Competibacteraceae bacterium]